MTKKKKLKDCYYFKTIKQINEFEKKNGVKFGQIIKIADLDGDVMPKRFKYQANHPIFRFGSCLYSRMEQEATCDICGDCLGYCEKFIPKE